MLICQATAFSVCTYLTLSLQALLLIQKKAAVNKDLEHETWRHIPGGQQKANLSMKEEQKTQERAIQQG